ncbi:MAG: 3-octaprenyl-4-hydroxybenzoate carboxy-lyase [Planctomycetaceae bacterium]|nr:3-octaprenyl-4-hydroxybenzoate carboxy-lyase [Planctomycetaceae bacterium]
MHNVVVAITGASGSIYATRLLEVLLAVGANVHVTISESGATVLKHELDLKVDLDNFDPEQLMPSDDALADDSRLRFARTAGPSAYAVSSVFSDSDVSVGRLNYHHYRDFRAGIASGSFLTDGMVIVPCSMGTLAGIANGLSTNLIHRAADVHLKERRKLIVVPRETPLGSIQLENMKRLADTGAVVLPAMPGFYHEPITIYDLVDFVVARICDHLEIPHELMKRWGTNTE